jgi:hypothetical protein
MPLIELQADLAPIARLEQHGLALPTKQREAALCAGREKT